jgi:hypothetical protein
MFMLIFQNLVLFIILFNTTNYIVFNLITFNIFKSSNVLYKYYGVFQFSNGFLYDTLILMDACYYLTCFSLIFILLKLKIYENKQLKTDNISIK